MTGEKHLPDGRRFCGWQEELPDPDLPCAECGKPWADHAGGVELRVVDGHAGRVMPRCPHSEGRETSG